MLTSTITMLICRTKFSLPSQPMAVELLSVTAVDQGQSIGQYSLQYV